MLDSGVICPSQSAWCNTVVLVQKDRGLSFCIDFCGLNANVKKDSYPLLRIQEVLESLVGAGHFSCLDLMSGFWQIKMDKSSKQYTALTAGNLGFFECDCMPFGLCNVPSMFQWLMQNYSELNPTYCLIYLDNIVIFSQMAEEHLHHLCIVFDWFREHNLKLKPSKCSFFREEITYLAHWISKDGVQPSNSNLEVIAECAPPQTYTEVHVFLGLVGHYRRFIKGLTCIVQPLSEYLTGKGPVGSQSGCHLQKMPWGLLKHWSRHVWQPPFWLLLATLNYFCWRLMHPRMDRGQCCCRSKQMGSTSPSPMAAGPLHLMRRTTTQLS